MSNYEATKYDFSGASLTGIEGIPTATIVPWSSSSVPTGFLECDGAAVSTTATLGQVSIDDNGSIVTIKTCFEDGCASGAVSTNTVAIE